jgi:hypothetical protein
LAIAHFRSLHATIAAVRRVLASLVTFALTVGARFIGVAKVALLGPIDGSITAVSCILACRGAAAVASVIDAVVTQLAHVNDTVAALDSAMRVTIAEHVTIIGTVVALLAGVESSVAARVQRHPAAAVGFARTG